MLNEKAKAIYNYICERIDRGYAPTVREICGALEIKSTSTVHRYINQLVTEGYLDKMDKQNRAIRLHGHSSRNVPVIGSAVPGKPLAEMENIEEYVSYAPVREHSGSLFAVRASDGALRKNGIMEGDFIIAEESDSVPAETVAVLRDANGKLTVRHMTKELKGLEPVGKAVALIRYLES